MVIGALLLCNAAAAQEPACQIHTFAGGDVEPASRVTLNRPAQLDAGPDGSIYVVDSQVIDGKVRSQVHRLLPDGSATIVHTAPDISDIAVDASGDVFVAHGSGVDKVTLDGSPARFLVL